MVSLVPQSATVEMARVVRRRDRHGQPPRLSGRQLGVAGDRPRCAPPSRVQGATASTAPFSAAPALRQRTTLYLSGAPAEQLLLGDALRCGWWSCGDVGAASAFKLAFAGFNKGLVALFLEVMAAAAGLGQRDELLGCLREFYPGTVETVERLLPSYPRHAARRADEMDELVASLRAQGSEAPMAAGAGVVLARFAALGLDAEAGWHLDAVLEACARRRDFLGGDADRVLTDSRVASLESRGRRPRVRRPRRPRAPARAGRARFAHDRARRRRQLVPCPGHEPVGAALDRDRPLGVGPHGEAGDAQVRALLLKPARIGDDEAGRVEERDEVQVPQRVEQLDAARERREHVRVQRLPRARVHGKDDGQLRADLAQSLEHLAEVVGVVHVGRTMQGDERVLAPSQTHPCHDRRSPLPPPGARTSVSIITLPTKRIFAGVDAFREQVARRRRATA